MKHALLPKISRRTFIGLGAATITAAAWGGVQLGRTRANLIALNFGNLSDSLMLGQLERLLQRYPGVMVTLLPTLHNLETLQKRDPQVWQRWLGAGHEIGFAAGMGQLSAEFLRWRTLLNAQPHFATDLRNAPSRTLATHSARHGMLVAAWQTAYQMPHVDQVTAQKSVLISAESLDLTQFDQLLTQLTEQGRQMVTLSDLTRNNHSYIEKLNVDKVGQQNAYDWLYR